jgi:predicted transglutaminase-like cysteine proteinase
MTGPRRSAIGWCWRILGRATVVAALVALPMAATAASPESFDGPVGWQRLCATSNDYCNTEPSRVAGPVDSKARELLAAINTEVNAAIEARDEPDGQDAWRLAPPVGDCEDYALTKKQRLIDAGWPGETLRFATVLTETDEYHAVLVVEHADGRLVLDNRFTVVQELGAVEAFGYRLVAVEGEGTGGTWRLTPLGSVVAMLLGGGTASR